MENTGELFELAIILAGLLRVMTDSFKKNDLIKP
jgi:hypothetical protein